jgi:hypothetical protein
MAAWLRVPPMSTTSTEATNIVAVQLESAVGATRIASCHA